MNFKFGIAALALAASLLAPGAWAVDAASSAAATFVAQGNKQWQDGRLEDARKSFEKAVAANPRSADAGMKLGGLLLASGDYAAAIPTYQRTIGLDSNNAKAWIGLGLAYLHTGKRNLSRAAFDEAVKADPSRKAQLAQLTERLTE